MQKVLALNKDGELTYCVCPPELRGKGRCNHTMHQNEGESAGDFILRVEESMNEEENNAQSCKAKEPESLGGISQDSIDRMAAMIDEIAGERLTVENWKDVMSRLTPDQVAEINNIAFGAAEDFSLPIRSEEFQERMYETHMYFADLPSYGIGGTVDSLTQMFKAVGPTISDKGVQNIEHSYAEGLTPSEYFLRQFSARDASISKSVNTAKPGYTARKLFYCMSDVMVFDDCGGDHIDALHCKLPEGHVCKKCANITVGGELVNTGDMIGGSVSTKMCEPVYQASMKQKHMGTLETSQQQAETVVIMATLDGWSTSEVIQKVAAAKTTEEARQIMYDGLTELYQKAKIKEDLFNIQMVARKLTSYKRTENGLKPVEDGEKCDVVSMVAVGSNGNIFKTAELGTGYRYLTKPREDVVKHDAANQILN